jgi:phosphatidyl-myo-inositol dimannoside synthase
LRTLVLATNYTGVGGAEAYTRMFAEAITAEGALVEVLSLLDGEDTDRSRPGAPLGMGPSRATRFRQFRFAAEALRRGRQSDLVVCGHIALAPVGALLSRLWGVPYVVVGYGIDVWGHLGARRRAALRQARRIVATSDFTARMIATIQQVPRDRICVVNPAVDSWLLREAEAGSAAPPRRNDVTLLTVARLSAEERYKGCDTVIAALPAVLAEGPIRYVIVGDGDDRPRLQALAEARGLRGAVTFAGTVQRRDLAAWYRECDIFIMPSIAEQRPQGWAGEGFGIVYLEAAAFGRPVIAGTGGGCPEAVQDGVTGCLVDGRDVNAVAETIARLARDRDARARMGAAGRQRVRSHFTFERFRREAGAVVRAALGRAGERCDLMLRGRPG